jgi:virginiamycin B lyase
MEFTLPALGSGPAGSLRVRRNPWFTEIQGNRVGRITTAGTITESHAPTIPVGNGPASMAAGSDGNMWFTEPGVGRVGRISLAVRSSSQPGDIVVRTAAGVWERP